MDRDERKRKLGEFTLRRLQVAASDAGIKGCSNLNKPDLITRLSRDEEWKQIQPVLQPAPWYRSPPFITSIIVAVLLAVIGIAYTLRESKGTNRTVVEDGSSTREAVRDSQVAVQRTFEESTKNMETELSTFFLSVATNQNADFAAALDYPIVRASVNKQSEGISTLSEDVVEGLPSVHRVQYRLELALIADRAGDTAKSKQILDRIKRDEGSVITADSAVEFRYHVQAGAVLSRLGQYDAALTHFRKSISIRPKSVWPRFQSAELATYQGEFASGIAQYSTVIKLLKEKQNAEQRSHWQHGIAAARTNKAQLLLLLDRTAEADELSKTALAGYQALHPTMPHLYADLANVWKIRGEIADRQGNKVEAYSRVNQAIEIVETKDESAANYRLSLLRWQLGYWHRRDNRFADASDQFSRSVNSFLLFVQKAGQSPLVFDQVLPRSLEGRFQVLMSGGDVKKEVEEIGKEIALAEGFPESLGSLVVQATLCSFRGRSNYFLGNPVVGSGDFRKSLKLTQKAKQYGNQIDSVGISRVSLFTSLQWLKCCYLSGNDQDISALATTLLREVEQSNGGGLNADLLDMFRWYGHFFRSQAQFVSGERDKAVTDLQAAKEISAREAVFRRIADKDMLVNMAMSICQLGIEQGNVSDGIEFLDNQILNLEHDSSVTPSDRFRLYGTRGDLSMLVNRHLEAKHSYEKAIKIIERSDSLDIARILQVSLLCSASSLLSTSSDEKVRNGERAMQLARLASERAGQPSAMVLSVLASAQAELGKFREAEQLQIQALELFAPELRDAERARLDKYRAKLPWRRPMQKTLLIE